MKQNVSVVWNVTHIVEDTETNQRTTMAPLLQFIGILLWLWVFLLVFGFGGYVLIEYLTH